MAAPVAEHMTELAELEGAEDQLLALASQLDEPVENTNYTLALLSLGQRARTLFRGTLALHHGDVPVAARVLLRPAVEINILVRFLRKEPDLHTELWYAEGERDVRTVVNEQQASAGMTERWGRARLPENMLLERKENIRKARERAREAKVTGVGENGAVLPGPIQQVEMLNEPAASEAYTLAYRMQSGDVHSGPQAVQAGLWEPRNDGTVSYRDEITGPAVGLRAMSLCTFASTLELVASELGLPCEEEAREVRRRFVPDTIPPEQRLDALSE